MTSLERAPEGYEWTSSISGQARRNIVSSEASKFLDLLDDLNMLPDPKDGTQRAFMKESLEALLKDNIEETQGMNLSNPQTRERYNQHLAMAKEILNQYEKMSGGKRKSKRSSKRSSKRGGKRRSKRTGRKHRKQKGGNLNEKAMAEAFGLKTRKRKYKNRRTRRR